jgi:hypothetical protein
MTTAANITAKVTKALTHLESGEIDKVKAILRKLVQSPKKHVLSGYNVFIGEMLKGKKMTMREACEAWKAMSAEEKAVFNAKCPDDVKIAASVVDEVVAETVAETVAEEITT